MRLICLVCLFAGAMAAQPHISERAQKLHREALVVDGHVHVIDRQFYHGGDIGKRVANGQFDLPRAREGGIDAMFLTIFVTEEYYPQRFETKQTLRLIDLALQQLETNGDAIGRRSTPPISSTSPNKARSPQSWTSRVVLIWMEIWGCCATFIAWACARRSSARTTGPTILPTRAARRPSCTV